MGKIETKVLHPFNDLVVSTTIQLCYKLLWTHSMHLDVVLYSNNIVNWHYKLLVHFLLPIVNRRLICLLIIFTSAYKIILNIRVRKGKPIEPIEHGTLVEPMESCLKHLMELMGSCNPCGI